MRKNPRLWGFVLQVLAATVLILAVVATPALGKASATPPGGSSSGGKAGVVYNAIPSKLPGSVPSQGFECCQTNEFGDEVGLGGTARTLQSMSVVLVSWGCENGHWYDGQPPNTDPVDCSTTPGATFNVPLTFTIYADDNGLPGDVLAQQTQTVNVLYRPSADTTHCTGDDAGKWYKLQDHTCYNGFAQTIKMTFSGVTLPSQVIWSAAYNTTTAGYHPIGVTACNSSSGGCGYDSLNVGAWSAPNAPYAGTDINEDEAFRNGGMEPGWTGYRPLGAIAATK